MKLFYTFLFFLLSVWAKAQLPAYRATVFDSTSTGYYFVAADLTLLILDRTGDVVYYKTGVHGGSFCLQPNGLMSYATLLKFYLMDSTFTVVDTVACKNLDDNDTHEFQILPNGHFLLLGSDLVTMDLNQYHWAGQYGGNMDIVNCGVIQEQDENHNVVFEWHAKDHFTFAEADTFYLSHISPITWTHCNALELDYDGNILLSSRNFNEITKINRADSSVMWRLGGSQNQFTFVNSPVPFYGQHDIRRLSNGRITLFDNGNNYVSHGARALEFELDEVNKIAIQTWSYTFDSASYSRALGNVQRLPDTHTLVNFGTCLNDTVGFVVVDSLGSRIFELDDLRSYRAFNYPSLPWQLHRPQITCFDSLGVTYLDAGAGHASYKWNNGDSTRIILIPAVIDTYYVFVPYGQGGFISSEKFIVLDTANLCSALSVFGYNDDAINKIEVFPNPTNEHITVKYFLNERAEVNVALSDVMGKIVDSKSARKKAGANSDFFDVSKLSPGIYFLRINEHAIKLMKQDK